MYAVIRTGGKQYRVTAGDILEVEKLDGDVGDTISLDEVLLVSNSDSATIGQPTVAGASVAAKITGQYRGKKILVFRYRPKKRIRVRKGHRQYLTRLEIESVTVGGQTYGREEPVAAADEPETEAVEDVAVEEEIVAEEAAAEEVTEEEVAVEEAAAEEVADEESVTEEESSVEDSDEADNSEPGDNGSADDAAESKEE